MEKSSNILSALGLTAGGGLAAWGGSKYLDNKRKTTPGHPGYVPVKKTESIFPDEDDPNDESFIGNAMSAMEKSPRHTAGADPGWHLGRALNKFVVKPVIKPGMETMREGGALSGAALGGLAGLPIGALIGLYKDGLGGLLSGALKGGLLGAGGMGLLTALGHRGSSNSWGFDKPFVNPIKKYTDYANDKNNFLKQYSSDPGYVKSSFEKQAFGTGANPTYVPLTNIYSSPISATQKAAMSAELNNLSPPQKSTLMRLLQGATGAAGTYIIAKYLLGLGKRTTMMSMILGALGGYNFR